MTPQMPILGVNAYHGDSSAALFTDGVLQAAVEEERFNRIKHWAGFPSLAIHECLRHTDPDGIEHIAISRNPGAHLARKVARALRHPGSWGRVAGREARGRCASRCTAHRPGSSPCEGRT